jgi:hypothetical protein
VKSQTNSNSSSEVDIEIQRQLSKTVIPKRRTHDPYFYMNNSDKNENDLVHSQDQIKKMLMENTLSPSRYKKTM